MHLPVRGGGRLRAGKVLGVVGNYAAHRAEMGRAPALPTPGPDEPAFFLKPTSSLLPGGGDIVVPEGVGRVEHEVELAVVIGRRGKRIAPEHALDHVFGYAIVLDITARDLQRRAKERGLPWTEGKGLDTFAPISPVVRRFQVRDPHDVELELRVNGEVRQQGSTKQMLVQVPELLARLSRFMTLEHGDVIATGTPAGVGPLVPGDTLEATASGLGALRCRVVRG